MSASRKGRKGISYYGEKNPNWRGVRVERPCPVCGTIFATEANTCSCKCGQVARRPYMIGKNNPTAKANPPIYKNCRVCSKPFRVTKGRYDERFYCSQSCFMKLSWSSVGQMRIAGQLRREGFIVELEKSWDWLRSPHSNCKLRVDIYLPSRAVAIEFDGRQHRERAFSQSDGAFRKSQERDRHKDRTLKSHGIRIIRITQHLNTQDLISLFDTTYISRTFIQRLLAGRG